MESTSTSKETPEIFIFFSIVSLTLILRARLTLTWRNLKSGRCDRPGANKVAGYVVFVSLISWLFAGHHIPAPAEFRVFGLAFNWAVGFGVMVWVFYVALEPFIRRRWPQLFISWTRLLRGQWSDGLVARDLLLGTACGVLDKMLWFGSVAVGARNQFFNVKQPLSDWVAWVLITHITTILTLFAGLLILALLGGVLRSKMLVGCVTIALVSTIIGHDAQLSSGGWASVLLVVALNMVILLRFGFLAAFGAALQLPFYLEGPLTTNPSVFYFSHTVLGMIAVATFAAYGAYFSVEKTIRADIRPASERNLKSLT